MEDESDEEKSNTLKEERLLIMRFNGMDEDGIVQVMDFMKRLSDA